MSNNESFYDKKYIMTFHITINKGSIFKNDQTPINYH